MNFIASVKKKFLKTLDNSLFISEEEKPLTIQQNLLLVAIYLHAQLSTNKILVISFD
jgi:hypothetical protein